MDDRTVSVWKFPLADDVELAIDMPRSAEVLSVHLQDGKPCLWALVEPSQPTMRRRIWVMGTGWKANPDGLGTFVGTILLDGGLVFHVFDGGEIGEATQAPSDERQETKR